MKEFIVKSTFNLTPLSFNEYFKSNIELEIRKYRGRKRLRKKKAKAALRARWMGEKFISIISRRIDYHSIGNQMIEVEDLRILEKSEE
jgi:hypothetical protein